MTEADWKQVKVLLDANVDNSTIHEVTGRARGTIKWVEQSKDFENYRNIVTDYLSKYGVMKPRLEAGNEKENGVPYPVKKDKDYQERIAVALETIGIQLERLVEAWQERPLAEKKGFWK